MSTPNASTLKQRAHALIDQLPEDATWRDVAEALAVVGDIEAGLVESEAGLGVDTATLRNRFGLPVAKGARCNYSQMHSSPAIRPAGCQNNSIWPL